MDGWINIYSSVTGLSHENENIPCQDSCHVLQNERWLSMVLSDGAGTARHSDKGSALVTKIFAKALMELGLEIDSRPPGAWINDYVIENIIRVRNELRFIANSDNISDYHCTLVACLLNESGGFLIHIGDGAVFGGTIVTGNDNQISLSSNFFISPPENGEYSNETFFITEGDWIKHLRITPVGKVDWLILATDGGTSLSLLGDKYPKPNFVIPLIKMLSLEKDPSKRQEVLESVLSDQQNHKITNDDKTICIALKSKFIENLAEYIISDFESDSDRKINQESFSNIETHRLKNIPHPKRRKILIPVMLIILGMLIGVLAILSYDNLTSKDYSINKINSGSKLNRTKSSFHF